MSYTCAWCGTEFKSYNPSPQFCSRKCKWQSEIADIDHARVKTLYASGMTQHEVAAHLNCGRKAVQNSLKRSGVKCRTAAKRNQWGDKNLSWKGSKASYFPKHRRVERRFGKPKKCQVCGTNDENLWYDWANLTGNYDDPNDYKRMCRSCHRKYDNRRKKCTTS